jgi:cytochrome bd-type quinol oxidase subunit 2
MNEIIGASLYTSCIILVLKFLGDIFFWLLKQIDKKYSTIVFCVFVVLFATVTALVATFYPFVLAYYLSMGTTP